MRRHIDDGAPASGDRDARSGGESDDAPAASSSDDDDDYFEGVSTADDSKRPSVPV
jgi:hypothetical protein